MYFELGERVKIKKNNNSSKRIFDVILGFYYILVRNYFCTVRQNQTKYLFIKNISIFNNNCTKSIDISVK